MARPITCAAAARRHWPATPRRTGHHRAPGNPCKTANPIPRHPFRLGSSLDGDRLRAGRRSGPNHRPASRISTPALDIYGPEILRSKLLQADGNDFHVHYRLHRHVLTVSAAYNCADFRYPNSFPSMRCARTAARIRRGSPNWWDAGLPGESEKPVGHDFGYLWRLDSYTRYLQRDGGVYIQTEFIALSRSVPAVFLPGSSIPTSGVFRRST